MLEIHLRQPGFTYRACGPFTENKKRIQKFIKTGDSWYSYQSELDKACFNMAYGDFKDLSRKTASDKILRHKAFNIAKHPKCDGYQCGLASMVFKYFDKKTSGNGIKNENTLDQRPSDLATRQLVEELHKPIIRKFNNRNVETPFIDNIWGDD